MMKTVITTGLAVFAMCAGAFGEFVVVIDPGHGGERMRGKSDGTKQGDGSSHNKATSASGARLEKEMTLDFSQAAAKALRDSPQAREMGGVTVVLTREDDRHLAAMMRAGIAVQHSADLFISIHFNAFDGATEGTRAYFCAEDHPQWKYVHFTNPYTHRDKAFGLRLAEEVSAALKPLGGSGTASVHGDDSLLHDGIRTLGLVRMDTHLYNAAVTLLEVDFIDNPGVEAWLTRDYEKSKQVVGKAIAKAVCDYLEEKDRWEVARPVKAPGR